MLKLFSNPSHIITCNTNGKNVKRGNDLTDLSQLEDHSIVVEDDLIKDLIPITSITNFEFDEVIDLRGKIILPGLIDCHTHSVFSGSRADEFRMKIAGVHYEEIAKKGGGINATVKAVRNSSLEELVVLLKDRVEHFITLGITTLEVKSGYGLDFENEVKLLKAIKVVDEMLPINIISTFLGAHTYPNELKNDHQKYLNEIINKMIPFIVKNDLAEFCDGFCEETAFSAEEIDKVFKAASENGLKLKLHTEQFNNIGGLEVALKHNATSVDHLEVLKEESITSISDSDTVAVLLPGVSFFLDYDYSPARTLIDSGAIVALATDYNPGSSHIPNLHFIMSIAALKMRMKIEEIINASTINAAKALGTESKNGSIEIGKSANFAVFNTEEYADVIYTIGRNLNVMTVKDGRIIYKDENAFNAKSNTTSV